MTNEKKSDPVLEYLKEIAKIPEYGGYWESTIGTELITKEDEELSLKLPDKPK